MMTIQQLASLAGVTVRTLRHYDQIGLLVPAARTEAGYRLYGSDERDRLQQILFFRELDFPLERIEALMKSPDFDKTRTLELQIRHLDERAARYASLAGLARKTLTHMKGDAHMTDNERFEGFDYDKMMAQHKEYEAEAEARWGNTEAWKISQERTSRMNKSDWERIGNAQEETNRKLAALFLAGATPDSDEVQACAHAGRTFIDVNFYPCSKEMFRGLGEMYVNDPRFSAYYDKYAPGLAVFYNNAIRIYCEKPE